MPFCQAISTAAAKASKEASLRLSLDVHFPRADLHNEGVTLLVAAFIQADTAVPLSLSLAGNELTAACCGSVASLLQSNVLLSVLDISYNMVRDDGAQLIASALVGNTSLQQLLLHGTGIGTSGAVALAVAGQQATALLEIDLRNNDGIISSDALSLAKPLILLSVAGGSGAEVVGFIYIYIYKNQTGILNNNFLVQCCSRHWHRRRRQSPVHTPRAYKCSRALCRLASACYFSLAVHVNTSFFDAPSLNRKPNGLFRMPKKTRLCRLQRSNASRRKRRALLPTLAIFLTG